MRILIVDDWPDTLPMLQLLLQDWEHETRVADDGTTALSVSADFKPDVVVLDLAIPGMDGYEVAERLQQHDQQKPVLIAHSGYCTAEAVWRSLNAGCSFHLTKPVEPIELRWILDCCEQLLQVILSL
jgi:CheY-like chemotaxis protein